MVKIILISESSLLTKTVTAWQNTIFKAEIIATFTTAFNQPLFCATSLISTTSTFPTRWEWFTGNKRIHHLMAVSGNDFHAWQLICSFIKMTATPYITTGILIRQAMTISGSITDPPPTHTHTRAPPSTHTHTINHALEIWCEKH